MWLKGPPKLSITGEEPKPDMITLADSFEINGPQRRQNETDEDLVLDWLSANQARHCL
jgi:hypothetical protein